MMLDLQDLGLLVRIALITAAITTTAFPIMYAFSQWDRSWLGRALMAHAIAFAFAVDINLLFRLYKFESLEFRYWLAILSYFGIAATTAFLTYLQWKYNHGSHNKKEAHDG